MSIEIERLNALGPYNHGVWSNGDISVGNEEALRGRAHLIIESIAKQVLTHFTLDEVSQMTMVDIGGYDGWISHELSLRLPFAKITCVEPRQKNIDKGITVREFLGIESRVKFVQGDLDSIYELGQQWDFVVCSGLLHHLTNIELSLDKLASMANKAVFIETQCYSPTSFRGPLLVRKFYKKSISVIEPKDLIYRFIPAEIGFSGHKFETNYLDGSATNFGVVSLPSPNLVTMVLKSKGFESTVVRDPKLFRKKILSKQRSFQATCVFGIKNEDGFSRQKIDSLIELYETEFLTTTIPNFLLKKRFYNLHLSRALAVHFPKLRKQIISHYRINLIEKEILTSLIYAFDDKTAFENVKLFLHSKDYESAIDILTTLVSKLNTDWRTTYKSFALLHLIHKQCGDLINADKYRQLTILANPNFPQGIFELSLEQLFKQN
jgi:hypothetical protein